MATTNQNPAEAQNGTGGGGNLSEELGNPTRNRSRQGASRAGNEIKKAQHLWQEWQRGELPHVRQDTAESKNQTEGRPGHNLRL
jgi:hypothetical protein